MSKRRNAFTCADVHSSHRITGVSASPSARGPGFAGLAQINAIVPAGLAAGDQPVFVTVNGVASNAGLITVK